MIKYLEVAPEEFPAKLLLEADPSAASISSYLKGSRSYIAKDEREQTIAACVLGETSIGVVEIFNIAVDPKSRARGVGTGLLSFVIEQMRSAGIERIELGTGSFGYQLTFYQRLGFRVSSVLKDHFLKNYADPIYENGIQHKDMLRLYLDL